MAISVPNTLSELRLMSAKLGILSSISPTGKDGKYSKEDYIVPIRNKNLQNAYGCNIPKHYLLLESIKSPMLSKRIDEVSQEIQDEVWSSDAWYLEEKINGLRCLMVRCGNDLKIFSRENSKETLLPIQMPVYFKNLALDVVPEDFILDCELVSESSNTCIYFNSLGINTTSSTTALEILLLQMGSDFSIKIQKSFDFCLKFYVFDCLYYNGWVVSEALEKRREIVDLLVSKLSGSGIPLQKVLYTNINKKQFYNKCLSYGLEGCIAKKIDSVYVADTKRNRHGWLKIKRVAPPLNHDFIMDSGSDPFVVKGLNAVYQYGDTCNSVGDTIDGFITGYVPGNIGTISEGTIYSLEVSVFVEEDDGTISLKSLGYIHNIEASVRDSVTSRVGGVVTLNPKYFNAVVELSSNPLMIYRLRFDKSRHDCVLKNFYYQSVVERGGSY